MLVGCHDGGVNERERLVREAFAALERGDFEAVAAAFAPDAVWRGPDPGEWDCMNRARIIEVMRVNSAEGLLTGEVEQVVEVDDGHALVAFRPANREADAWPPLDPDGLRWVVLRFGEDGLVTEMRGQVDRAAAEAYAVS